MSPLLKTLGGAGGALAAGSAGRASGLGGLLDLLDSPRQALWNLVRSGKRAITGEGTWDDALAALPGALGAGLAGGLMASGVGAPLGALAGSLLGGAAQSVGNSAAPETFHAAAPSDVVSAAGLDPESAPGMAASFGLGMATDPLTFAGGLGGLRGAKALEATMARRGAPAASEIAPLAAKGTATAAQAGAPERIAQAAFRQKGKVYPAGVFHDLGALPADAKWIMEKAGGYPEAGFLTDNGRFVDRHEAAQLAGLKDDVLGATAEDLGMRPPGMKQTWRPGQPIPEDKAKLLQLLLGGGLSAGGAAAMSQGGN